MPAIQYCHARYISRGRGGSATRSAAYNNRIKGGITDERTGQHHQFEPSDDNSKPDGKGYREAPAFGDVLLPEGAPAAFKDRSVLWNAAERAERRKDSQVAREILLALPNDPQVTRDHWHEMTVSFAQHFVSKGVAVQYDIHVEHPDNPHAHLLITTRRIDASGFNARKATDLDPVVRSIGGKIRLNQVGAWGEVWRQYQNNFFAKHGIDLRVEPLALVTRTRLRQQSRGEDALEAHIAENRKLNAEAARDPANVLTRLQETYGAEFTSRELNQFLRKHLPDPAQRTEVRTAVAVLAAKTNEHFARRYEIQLRSLRPWMLKAGGADALDRFDADAAGRAYSRWAERKGLEAKMTFEAYVSFVQQRWAAHPENREALVKRANENADPWQRAERREQRQPSGRISPDLDSRYNRGGGWYDEDASYGRRM